MNLSELFRIKEELLKDLDAEIEKMNFANEEEKQNFRDAHTSGILNFYVQSMISILDKAA